jgi:hypothetical protein
MPTFLLVLLAPLADVSFNRDVRPILSDACFTCHGPDAARRKAGLRLDTEAGAREALKGELWRRVSAHGKGRMPPPSAARPLSDAERAVLKRWLDAGAKWEPHWAFLAPVKTHPGGSPSRLAWNPIDALLAEKLAKEGHSFAPEAPPEAWLRRVTLDLTGLPPTAAEQDAYLADRRPGARERVVERLLASPRFGERMAVRWMEAARYADTNGYQSDGERVMWRWRDWVIDAYNANMPFDQFTIEQLAGDLLDRAEGRRNRPVLGSQSGPDDPYQVLPSSPRVLATGFNRNHRLNAEGGIVPEEYAAEYVADRVETTSTVWLGLTMTCARCHDHKYDPVSTRDFYRLFAFFNNVPERGKAVKFGNSPPLVLSPTRWQEEQLKRARDDLLAAKKMSEGEPGVLDWLREPARADKAQPPMRGEKALPGAKVGAEYPDEGAFAYTARFAISMTITPEKPDGVLLSRMDDSPDGAGYSVELVKGRVQVNLIKRRLDDAIRVEALTPVPMGRPTALAVSYDGSRWARGVRVYVGGKKAEVRVLLDELNQPFDSKAPLRIGAGGPGPRFAGAIRDVKLFSHSLEPVDAAELATPESVAKIRKLPLEKMTLGQVAKLERYFLAYHATGKLREARRREDEAFRRLQALLDSLPSTMVMEEMPKPRETFLLKRGQYDAPGERVSPGTPAALPPMAKELPPNRLGLARWIVSPENPLTARVAVNRLWQMLFGTGLVETVDDFGSQGSAPTHPELLDWLAVEFREPGWDVKHILRLLVTSRAYAQSSRVTPAPAKLLARMPRLRLSAEMVRDQALAAAGLVTNDLGGPSVKPYQPEGLWRELADVEYQRDTGQALYRRGLYVFWKRTVPPPGLAAFDAPTRESCAVRETRTNTPLQALNLLNDVTYVEAARVLAQRALERKGDAARLEWLMRSVLARRPREAEAKILLASLARHREHYTRHPEAARKLIRLGDSAPVGDPSELAALTAVASMILNLDEAVTRE